MRMRMMKTNLNREFKKASSAVTVVGFPVKASFPDLIVELVWRLVEPTLRISIGPRLLAGGPSGLLTLYFALCTSMQWVYNIHTR